MLIQGQMSVSPQAEEEKSSFAHIYIRKNENGPQKSPCAKAR